jgi:chemotaxis protein MotB
MKNLARFASLGFLIMFISGCQTLEKARMAETLVQENKKLTELERAKAELASSLEQELKDYKAKLKITERGLVITFLAEIFFDSGKDVIKENAKSVLDKVAKVLNESVADSYVAVEGYTDNDPIKYSGWRSNWELSSARALAVLHYFVDFAKVNPERFSAVGYSEYRPVVDNVGFENKRQNRRVEIVILPSKIEKVKTE